MTYSGTGTRATMPSQVTAGQVIAGIRIASGCDDEAMPDAVLLDFLNEAIREYSQHLTRLVTTRLAAVEGADTYALPVDALDVIDVAYPDGQEPPAFLPRLSRKSERFLWTARAYDYLPRRDLHNPPMLLLNFQPEPGETIVVRHTAPHLTAATVNDYLTVPADHHHVLVQYVFFAIARRQQAAEQATPTADSPLLMAQLASNARRLELAYLNALNRILTQRQGVGRVVGWAGPSSGWAGPSFGWARPSSGWTAAGGG